MTQETPKDTTPAGYKRSSFAVPEQVHKSLPDLVKALGLRSVAALLVMLVRHQAEVIAALLPVAAKFKEEQKSGSNQKAARKELQDKLKGMSPEKLAELLRLAEAQETQA